MIFHVLDLCWDKISQYFPSFPWELPGALSVNIRNSRFGCIERDDMEDEVMGGSFNPIHLGHALLDSSLASPAILSNRKYSLFVHNCAQLLAALYLHILTVYRCTHICVHISLHICCIYVHPCVNQGNHSAWDKACGWSAFSTLTYLDWIGTTDHFTSRSELPEAGNHK